QYGSPKDKELHSQIWVGDGKVVLPWNLGQYGNLVNTFGARIDYEILKNDQPSAGSKIRGKNLVQTPVALNGKKENFFLLYTS
ncbi:ligand-gated channel, partial [Campylobacter jejuni]